VLVHTKHLIVVDKVKKDRTVVILITFYQRYYLLFNI